MAMIMMLVLVPVLMFLAASFVDPIVRSFRSAVNDQKTLLAKNVAQNAFELALWESRGTGIGENTCNDQYPGGEVFEYDFGDATVRWCVMGSPEIDEEKLIDNWYTIPSPGSGTAGDDYCNTNEPVVSPETLSIALAALEIEKADLGDYDEFDWPCNWNKLREGENIEIPLYTEDSEGNVLNPIDLGLNEFELTIRTPCNPDQISNRTDEYTNQICKIPYASGERYVLEGDNPGEGVNTVIVLWEITGKQGDESGDSVVIGQLDEGNQVLDTKFTARVLNGNHPLFTSLKESTKGQKNDGDTPQIGPELQNLYKPVLRIIPVHTLQGLDGTVPYLEYQFKAKINTSLDKPVSNTSKVVHVEVMVDGGYSETIDKIVDIAKSVSGFVIQQYLNSNSNCNFS